MFLFYRAILDDKNIIFETDNLSDFAKVSNGDYSSVSNMKIFENHNDEDYYQGDFTWLDNSTVLLAKKSMKDLKALSSLTFSCMNGSDLYNLVEVESIDCLDFSKSKISYFEDGKAIKSVDKFVFKASFEPSDRLIFKILGYDFSPIIYTKKFVDIFETNKISGLKFRALK